MRALEHKAESERIIDNVHKMLGNGDLSSVSAKTASDAITILVSIAQVHATLANAPDPKPSLGPV